MRFLHKQKIQFTRIFSAISSQALSSAGNFIIGMILIRNTSSIQYGYYVLVFSAILLFKSLQTAFFSPPLSIRFPKLDQSGRSELAGGLYREQRRILPPLGIVSLSVISLMWYFGLFDRTTGPLAIVSVIAILVVLYREYFRTVLFALRLPQSVILSDFIYVLITVIGAYFAIFTSEPATLSVISLCFAAFVSGILLFSTLRKIQPWDIKGAKCVLREIAPMSTWSTAGSGVHWLFGQGYVYLVAATLGVTAVSTIAVTRILLQPINLISTGIASLMLPMASNWLHKYGARLVWWRLILFAASIAITAILYFAVLWWFRDWIFANILKKQFASKDSLLLLWGGIVLITVVRDQLVYLLASQGRYRTLFSFTFICAIISLVASYTAMLQYGVKGALLGMLLGEFVNLVGIVVMSVRTIYTPITEPARSAA